MTRLVVCADDYGLTDGVSRGILDLAGTGRVSATSCMTNMPGWRRLAPSLAPFAGRIGIGLHLTLTWGRPCGAMPSLAPGDAFPPLATLMRGLVTGRIARAEIEAEIDRQLDAFGSATGREPDFVDGHQHVHTLPVVRGALLEALSRRSLAGRVWLRDPSDRVASSLARPSMAKALLVTALSAGFGSQATRAGFATNDGFSGFSEFSEDRDLAADFARYLSRLGPRPLVMCHPGHVDDRAGLDSVVDARRSELAFLASPAWPDILAASGSVLVPAPA